jgi:putative DNA primase/helicase
VSRPTWGQLVESYLVQAKKEGTAREAALDFVSRSHVPHAEAYGLDEDSARAEVEEIAERTYGKARRTMRVEGARFDQEVEAAAEALCGAEAPGADALFMRGGRIVRVREDVEAPWRAKGLPTIHEARTEFLRVRLAQVADFVNGKGKLVRPPDAMIQSLRELTLPLPVLSGITDCPTLRPDGTVLCAPGYDTKTGLLYVESRDFAGFTVSEHPTAEEVKGAKAALLALLEDFPFITESDRAAAVALILTAVARSAFDGPAPFFAVTAPAPGTGKSYLAKLAGVVATGREPQAWSAPKEENELKKALLAICLEGDRVVFDDNAESPWGSAELSKLATSREYRARLLGVSEMRTAPWNGTLVTTGNNLSFRADIARRVVLVRLDAGMERPELRSFARDLLREAAEDRPALVADCLMLLRGYLSQAAKGRRDRWPEEPGFAIHRMPGYVAKASFEGWDNLIRRAVRWAGFGDPDGNAALIAEEADSDGDSLRETLAVLSETFPGAEGSSAFTSADVVRAAGGDETLKTAVLGLTEGRPINGESIGKALRRAKGRPRGGLVLRRHEGEGRGGAVRWYVGAAGLVEG